eukprot:COSAG03_NODE_6312_length_1080_cov_0.881753_1_plen_267_part_10
MEMMEQAAKSTEEIWMDADDKLLAEAVGRLLKASGQATDGWADVAGEMGSGRTEKGCRSRWEVVKNRPHLVTICGGAAGVDAPVSYGHILLEKAEEAQSQKDSEGPKANGLLSGTEWTTEEDNLLREAVRTCAVDGAVTSWSRVAQLVGNNRSAQPCRGRWRRLKKNDDKTGGAGGPAQGAQVAVQQQYAHLESMGDSERALLDAAARKTAGKASGGGGQAMPAAAQMDVYNSTATQAEVMMDRPGWTAAWSYEHNTWYWWNDKHET